MKEFLLDLFKRKSWSIEESLELINLAQPVAREAGYYLSLAYGSLNKEELKNKLELLAISLSPLEDANLKKLLLLLQSDLNLKFIQEYNITVGSAIQFKWKGKLVELLII